MVIDIPKDITDPNIKIPYEYPKRVKMRSYSPVTKGHLGQIKKAINLMLNAERPVFYTGGGVVLDNAIVVLERITRRRHEQPEDTAASHAVEGTAEVGPAIEENRVAIAASDDPGIQGPAATVADSMSMAIGV